MARFSSVDTSTSLVLSFVVMLLIIAFVGPVALDSYNAEETTTLTQDESVTYTVAGMLQSNVTNVDGTNTQATIKLNRSNTEVSNTVGVGSTVEYTVDGYAVNVTVDSINTSTTPNEATVTYGYPKGVAWSDSTSSIWDNLPVIAMVGIMLAILYLAIDRKY